LASGVCEQAEGAAIAPPKEKEHMSEYHWLYLVVIAVAIGSYLLWLVRLAKPKVVEHNIETSKVALSGQTIIAWLSVVFFGFLTFAGVATWQKMEVEDPNGTLPHVFAALLPPLFLALSIRWYRSLKVRRSIKRSTA
jgi:hypothetical protein